MPAPPGAGPGTGAVPVDLDVAKAVIAREVHRHNAEAGRRGQGMKGRSYRCAFVEGLALRVRRQPTARQLCLAGLVFTAAKVDRWGRVQVAAWTFGRPETQQELLPCHQRGQAILLGRDPRRLAGRFGGTLMRKRQADPRPEASSAEYLGNMDGARKAITALKARKARPAKPGAA